MNNINKDFSIYYPLIGDIKINTRFMIGEWKKKSFKSIFNSNGSLEIQTSSNNITEFTLRVFKKDVTKITGNSFYPKVFNLRILLKDNTWLEEKVIIRALGVFIKDRYSPETIEIRLKWADSYSHEVWKKIKKTL